MRPNNRGETDYVINRSRMGQLISEDAAVAIAKHKIMLVECELCEAIITATPVSFEQLQKPDWHLVCRESAGTLGAMKFAGRNKRGATELPKPADEKGA